MANVKTTVSLEKSLLEKADALAREMNVSGSRLFTFAIEEFIRREESRRLLDQINAAYDDGLDEEERTLLHEMSYSYAAHVEHDRRYAFMEYKGTAKGSVIELDEPLPFAEGTRVEVSVVPESKPRKNSPQAWIQLAGTLTDDEAEAIMKFVNERVRRVDEQT